MINHTEVAHMGYHCINDDNCVGENKEKENRNKRHDSFFNPSKVKQEQNQYAENGKPEFITNIAYGQKAEDCVSAAGN